MKDNNTAVERAARSRKVHARVHGGTYLGSGKKRCKDGDITVGQATCSVQFYSSQVEASNHL